MRKIILRTALVLVGGHLLLGVTLLAVEATHGLSDQDASFVITLAFYYLNLPSFWMLRSMGSAPPITMVIAVGIIQWTGLSLAIGVTLHMLRSAFRTITARASKTVEPPASHGPGTAGAEPDQ